MGEPTESGTGGGGGFTPITTQDELNRIIDERLRRQKQQFADYGELKRKAEQFDALQEKATSDETKFNERLAALEGRISTSEADRLRWRIAAKHKISEEDAELFLLGTDEETLEKQAKRLVDRDEAAKPKKSAVVPKEGATSSEAGTDELREFTRKLFQPEGANS